MTFQRIALLSSLVFITACAACGPGNLPEESERQQSAACPEGCTLASARDEMRCEADDPECCDWTDPTCADGGEALCVSPLACPAWCDYMARAPCLVEDFEGYAVYSYCEPSTAPACAAIRQYFVSDSGACLGMDRVEGESISSCLGT